jgi:Tfp pilus assembly protein PilO
MKALYSSGSTVRWSRIFFEHRRAVVPLAVVFGISVLALIVLVLPLSQRVESAEQRAVAAERQLSRAEADYKQAEVLRAAKAKATADLDKFYQEVLPTNVGAARRILQLKLRQQAAAHGVQYTGGATIEEQLRDSSLLRLTMTMTLIGSYENIRDFIYEIETSPEFVVIENLSLSEAPRGETGLEVSLAVATYYRNAAAAVLQTNADGR